jgi:hypothetical protein
MMMMMMMMTSPMVPGQFHTEKNRVVEDCASAHKMIEFPSHVTCSGKRRRKSHIEKGEKVLFFLDTLLFLMLFILKVGLTILLAT